MVKIKERFPGEVIKAEIEELVSSINQLCEQALSVTTEILYKCSLVADDVYLNPDTFTICEKVAKEHRYRKWFLFGPVLTATKWTRGDPIVKLYYWLYMDHVEICCLIHRRELAEPVKVAVSQLAQKYGTKKVLIEIELG